MMKMKKMHLCHLKLKNITIIQKLKKMKNKLSKVPRVTYNEFENALQRDMRNVLKFGITHKIKLMRYEGLI